MHRSIETYRAAIFVRWQAAMPDLDLEKSARERLGSECVRIEPLSRRSYVETIERCAAERGFRDVRHRKRDRLAAVAARVETRDAAATEVRAPDASVRVDRKTVGIAFVRADLDERRRRVRRNPVFNRRAQDPPGQCVDEISERTVRRERGPVGDRKAGRQTRAATVDRETEEVADRCALFEVHRAEPERAVP